MTTVLHSAFRVPHSTLVLYSCPFVPAEWIAAHGLRPSRIIPRAAGGVARLPGVGEGACPYVKALVHEICVRTDAAAIVLTTTCDQMRRASELVAQLCDTPLFLFHVPKTWQTVAAQKLYGDELQRLGQFLVRLGGESPSCDELVEVMDRYDQARATLRAARGQLSPRQFSQAIADFHDAPTSSLPLLNTEPASLDTRHGIAVALIGGPLLANHFDLFDHIEAAGGRVVLDATTTGERTVAAPFDRRTFRDDPIAVLADAYFGAIPDAFRRPNSELYVWLKGMVAERGVRGIIFRYAVWCDTWHAEAQRMKEWAAVPLLVVAAGGEENINGHAISRIQSFLETLK